jgi:sugar (pentulose or hexulose) kinase
VLNRFSHSGMGAVDSYVAVDLGAASGRVMVGHLGAGPRAGRLELVEAHRFANRPVRLPSGLHWDILALYAGVLDGVRAASTLAGDSGPVSVGIDAWAVDYGLLDESGALLGNPFHYRDSRTDGIAAPVPAAEMYAVTGLQHLPFNTAYQLLAEPPWRLAAARTLLMIPDLISYWLTGRLGAEATNASTTQLYDVHTRDWSTDLMRRLGIPSRLFPPLRQPGSPAGTLLPQDGLPSGRRGAGPRGLAGLPVVAVGSHDTASAVVAVPAADHHFAYISCGTWALVGLELSAPVLSEASRRANFTNEGGVLGTVRYLRNVMGLWLLQESLRHWPTVSLDAVLSEAAREPAFGALIDPDDPAFLPPGDMPSRIADYCRRTGQAPPPGPAATVRCILDSLALAFRATVRAAQELSGREVRVVHLVGGGARNELLCQLTADACGLPVVAGPTEATALGNVLVQAGAALSGGVKDLAGMRALVAATQPTKRYAPRGDRRSWDAAAARLD